MKKKFECYMESENCEIEIALEAKITTWKREIETPVSPPIAAGYSIDDVYIIGQPDLQAVRAFIRDEAGTEHILAEFDSSGITFCMDINKGISIQGFDNDALSDYITTHFGGI